MESIITIKIDGIDEMLKEIQEIKRILEDLLPNASDRSEEVSSENEKEEARMEPDPPFKPETMMTTRQAAEFLGVTDGHVLELSRVRKGKTPALHRYGIPGKYYFLREEVERYAETRKNRGGAARFFTPAEAANYSGIPAPQLRRLAKAGILQQVKKGRRIYFRKCDLDRYMNMQKDTALPFS